MLGGSFQGIRGEIDTCFDFVRESREFFALGFLALGEFLQLGVSVGGVFLCLYLDCIVQDDVESL